MPINKKKAQPTTFDELKRCATADVPVFGRLVYRFGRNGSYDAVKAGLIPVIRIGANKKKMVVPVRRALEQEGLWPAEVSDQPGQQRPAEASRRDQPGQQRPADVS
jgi:hypothetical protein